MAEHARKRTPCRSIEKVVTTMEEKNEDSVDDVTADAESTKQEEEINHEGEDGYGSCCEEEKALVDHEEVLSNPG